MGLDMYLTKKTYVQNWDHHSPESRFSINIERGGKPFTAIKPERITYVIEEVGYWRKANQIHGWFVENVQKGVDECQESYVSIEKLRELLGLVNAVIEDPSKAQELLPTRGGFFFGSTEYDEYYMQDLELTKKILDGVMAEVEEEEKNGNSTSDGYYYHASW